MSDLRIPAETVGNREVTSSDGAQIAPEKLWHLEQQTTNFGFAIGDTPTTKEVVLFVAKKAGSLDEVSAQLDDSGTSTSVAFDLKLNGASMLSGTIAVVHGTGDRVPVVGTFADANYGDGDTVSAAMTVSSSTGAKGPSLTIVRRQRGA
jgi:hypothetical protein